MHKMNYFKEIFIVQLLKLPNKLGRASDGAMFSFFSISSSFLTFITVFVSSLPVDTNSAWLITAVTDCLCCSHVYELHIMALQ